VPEPLGDDVHWDSLAQQKGGVGVAQLMKRPSRHLKARDQPPEGGRDVVRRYRATVLPGEEDVLVIAVGAPETQPFRDPLLPPGPQGGDEVLVKGGRRHRSMFARQDRAVSSVTDRVTGLAASALAKGPTLEHEPCNACSYGHTFGGVARAATTTDAFNAVAEPRRRQILDTLARSERSVTSLVEHLGLGQPQVSKHLRVLRAVGLVEVTERGRQRLYRVNGGPLEDIHTWVSQYEAMWGERLDEVDALLNELERKESEPDGQRDKGQRRRDAAE
jgi:DNA-binding transcriptional ArsR family regulator